jgi:hypothetical protein
MNNNLEPVNYDSIYEVFSLARRLANENRQMHLDAAKDAKSQDEFETAIKAARVAFAEADSVAEGQKRFVASESSFHTGTLDMMSGKDDAAKASFAAAGEQLGDAAKQIDMFAEYMPRSKYMDVAIQNVARRDGMLETAEKGIHNAIDNIALTVKGFATGLKVFAGQVAEFGQRAVQIPDQVQKIVKEKSVSVVEATSIATMSFLTRAKNAVQNAVQSTVKAVNGIVDGVVVGVQEKVKAANETVNNGLDYLEAQEIQARQRAWNTIEKCAQYAVDLKNEVKSEVKGAAQAGAQKFAQGVGAAASAIDTGMEKAIDKVDELADKIGNKVVEVAGAAQAKVVQVADAAQSKMIEVAEAAQAKIDKAEVNVRAVAGTVTAVAGLARAVVSAQYLQSKTAAADNMAQRKAYKPT